MLDRVLPALFEGPAAALDEIEALDDEVDALHGQIIEYLGRVGRRSLSEGSTDELLGLMEATNNLEAIGDLIETNLVPLGRRRLAHGYEAAAQSRRMIEDFHHHVSLALDLSVAAVVSASDEDVGAVSAMKDDIDARADEIASHRAVRLGAPDAHRIPLYRFETDVVTNLRQIYYFARRTAKAASRS